MTDTIGVNLVANDDQFVASTKAASVEMARLAAQEEKLGKAAKDSGLDQKKFSATFGKIERQRLAEGKKAQVAKDRTESLAAKAAALTQKKDAAKKAADDKKAAKLVKEAEAQQTQRQRAIAKIFLGRRAVILGEASGIGTGAVAAVEMGAALITATVAAGALLTTIAALALKADVAKQNTIALLDVVTGGRGQQQLAALDGLAKQLGISITDTRAQFVAFREKGLDNIQSANLIKLRADLLTVDKSGDLAAQAVERVLKFTSPGGRQTTLQTQAIGREFAVLEAQAKKAGFAVGDGLLAASAASTTYEGAINRLGNAASSTLEQIGAKTKPSIDAAASSVANLVDKFLSSEEGKQVIEDVSEAINVMAKDIGDAADIATKALADPTVRDALKLTGKAIVVVGHAVGSLVAAVLLAPVAFAQLFAAIGTLEVKAERWGENIVTGLITGLDNIGPRLSAAVSRIGDRITDKFTGIFQIHSPSKLFAGYGMNMGAGLRIGLGRSMPDGGEMARAMVPPRAELAPAVIRASVFTQQPAPIFGSQQAGPSGSTFAPVFNFNANADSDEIRRQWRREADLWYRGIQQQSGL